MDAYMRHIDYDILPATYNAKVADIYKFFRYMVVKGYIKKVPFNMEYYLKNVVPVHHDRAVPEETVKKMLPHIGIHILCRQ